MWVRNVTKQKYEKQKKNLTQLNQFEGLNLIFIWVQSGVAQS